MQSLLNLDLCLLDAITLEVVRLQVLEPPERSRQSISSPCTTVTAALRFPTSSSISLLLCSEFVHYLELGLIFWFDLLMKINKH